MRPKLNKNIKWAPGVYSRWRDIIAASSRIYIKLISGDTEIDSGTDIKVATITASSLRTIIHYAGLATGVRVYLAGRVRSDIDWCIPSDTVAYICCIGGESMSDDEIDAFFDALRTQEGIE